MSKLISFLLLGATFLVGPAAFAQTTTTGAYPPTTPPTTTPPPTIPNGGFEASTFSYWGVVIIVMGLALLWFAYRQQAKS